MDAVCDEGESMELGTTLQAAIDKEARPAYTAHPHEMDRICRRLIPMHRRIHSSHG